MLKNQHAKRLRLFCVPAILSLFIAAPTMSEETPDSAVELPTVLVSSQAMDALGYVELEKETNAGKLNVPIQYQPFSISVIDPEFMKDIGAKNI